jgi:hypothetical protein
MMLVSSVADPRCLSWIQGRLDPGSRIFKSIFNPKTDTNFFKIRSGMFIPDPGSWHWIFSIPDPGVKKAPRIRIRNTARETSPFQVQIGPIFYIVILTQN